MLCVRMVAAASVSLLVPLDLPFVEGERYRKAGATEWPGRLDLYRTDPAGPWVRRHGVLLRAPETLPEAAQNGKKGLPIAADFIPSRSGTGLTASSPVT